MSRRATRHIGFHRNLLGHGAAAPPTASARIAAVVVPAARPASGLAEAVCVAVTGDAVLVVLCSHKCSPTEAYGMARSRLPAERVVVISTPRAAPQGLPALAADSIEVGLPRRRDTAMKRNLGLRLALLAGWDRILFLDDDVSGLTADDLRTANTTIDRATSTGCAVSWACEDFPDNSIVCHANRLSGRSQGVFVGGGALALAVSPRMPHFPTVYNEDWLFFAELLAARNRSLTIAGLLRQGEMNPFANPEHVRRQEFGDVLAEGLFALLHSRRPLDAALTTHYWAGYLAARKHFVADVLHRLRAGKGHGSAVERSQAMACLVEARATLEENPHWRALLPEYVSAWRQDAKVWRRTLTAQVCDPMGVDDALRELGLSRLQPPPRESWRDRVTIQPVPAVMRTSRVLLGR